MSCTRNVEEEGKKSVSKAHVLGYFTSLINKKKKQQRILKCTKKEKRTCEACRQFCLFVHKICRFMLLLFVQVLNDRPIMRLADFRQIIFLRHLVFHLIRPG